MTDTERVRELEKRVSYHRRDREEMIRHYKLYGSTQCYRRALEDPEAICRIERELFDLLLKTVNPT